MTVVGSGGVYIKKWTKSKRFHREYDKLDISMRDKVDAKLQDLARQERPAGLVFEKLSGYDDPTIYTIHVTGNYKISMEITGDCAWLRRVDSHDEIDRAP